MLSPSEYDRLCDQIITLYDDLDNAIISDITRRIVKSGRVTETAKWQAKQLQGSGLLYDDIISEIASRTDATGQHVRTLFEDSGVQSIRNDNRRYRAAGLEGIVKMSDSALQTLYAGYVKCGGDLQNLTLTTANISQTAYINACNQAYMQVTSGAFSYQEAIKQAVQRAAQNGTYVQYPSGHRDRLDVAVRRSVLTGVGQTVRQISLINANDMGCDLMEITAHSGARPSHAAWQGQLVSLSGRRGYLSLKDIGYGTGDGFGGWNCRHDWFPFFEGISEPAYTARQLAEFDEKCIEYNGVKYSEYEISQIQRKIEREIRSAKREQVAFKVAVAEADNPELRQVMQDSLNYAKSLVRDKQAKMRDFIRQTGQNRDYFREQNYPKENIRKGLTSVIENVKIISPKKSKSFRIPITNKNINNMSLIQPYGFTDENAVALQDAHKRLLKEARKHRLGTECAIILDLDMEQIGDIIVGRKDGVRIPHCDEYYMTLHNHSSGETFSIGDMLGFSKANNMQVITIAGNNGKAYVLSKTMLFDSEKFNEYIMNNINNRKIFKEKTYMQIDEVFVSSLTPEEKEELKKTLIQFSEEILKGVELYGAIYEK